MSMGVQELTLVLAAINTLVLPLMLGIGRWIWTVEKRILATNHRLILIESRLGLHQRADDTRIE